MRGGFTEEQQPAPIHQHHLMAHRYRHVTGVPAAVIEICKRREARHRCHRLILSQPVQPHHRRFSVSGSMIPAAAGSLTMVGRVHDPGEDRTR